MDNSAVETTLSVDELEAIWMTDFERYASDQLMIQPMETMNQRKQYAEEVGGTQLKPLVLNEPQKVLDSIILKIRSEGRLVRLVILKARREGVSTYTSGRFYWMTTTRFNRYSMLIAHEPEATEFLFQMHKRFYQHNPIWRPTITYNNKRLLNFDTSDGKGLGSAIRVATAGKEDIGSSQAIHYLHLSELAKWPAHTTDAILTSVLQCVQRSLDTEVVIESTAKGVGGEFYDRYWSSRYRCRVVLKDDKPHVIYEMNDKAHQDNVFTSIFLPWFIFEEYQMDVPESFVRTPYETELASIHGLTDRRLAWRRWCIANNCGGDEDVFKQEYPSTPEEAFLGTGNTVFNTAQLERLRKSAPDPIARYSVRPSDGQFISNNKGEFLVWEESRPGEEYLIAADVGEGLARNTSGKIADWSVATVWKISTGEQVAEWHGKIDADQFGVVLCHLGVRYNTAVLAPERNNHGNATVLKIVDLRYPRIYVERVPEPPNKIRKRFGWLTTRTNKVDIVTNMQAEMRDETHGIKSKEIFSEMISYMQDGDKYGAEVGKFDDRVMSAMIGKFVLPRFRKAFAQGRYSVPLAADRGSVAPPVEAWIV